MDSMIEAIYGDDAVIDSVLTATPGDGRAAGSNDINYEQLYARVAASDLSKHDAATTHVRAELCIQRRRWDAIYLLVQRTQVQELAVRLEAKTKECEQLKQQVADLQQQVTSRIAN